MLILLAILQYILICTHNCIVLQFESIEVSNFTVCVLMTSVMHVIGICINGISVNWIY